MATRTKVPRLLIRLTMGGVAALCTSVLAATAATVDFEQEIRPLLKRSCVPCHGPEKQKGGLRLDRRTAAMKGGDDGPAILPGRGKESLLVRLAAGEDPDRFMPAKGDHLTPAELALLRAWIDQGADWPDDPVGDAPPREWWSLKPLQRPGVPPPPRPSWIVRNPIDAFLAGPLAAKGLAQAPEAERRTLIRRLSFDLTGLPPTPAEVESFQADPDPGAYEQLVERLLASPRHGERWARHWMDVARFAETHGHDQDRVRENAWPYRDYLVRAFNADIPYARFVAEQVAGDALFPDEPDATVALGFLAAGPWDESSLRDIREDTLDRQIGRYLDRDDVVTAVMQTFASTTVQCARCHDHKFDPVSQEDYYALQAVFAGVDKANRRYDPDPAVGRRRRELTAQLKAVERGDRGLLFSADTRRRVESWEASIGRPVSWESFRPETFLSTGGADLTLMTDGSLLAGGKHATKDVYALSGPAPVGRLTAVRLEVMTDGSLPQQGPGRETNGNFHLSEFRLMTFEPGATAARPVALTNATADFNQAGWAIGAALDGDDKTAWGIFPEVGRTHTAVFELAEPLQPSNGTRLTFLLHQLHGGHCIGRLRLSLTGVEPAGRAAVLPPEVQAALDIPAGDRREPEHLALAQHVLRSELRNQLAALPPARSVFAAAGDFEPDGGHKPAGGPRPVHVLRRGDVRHPLAPAAPGTLSCVTVLPARFTAADDSPEGQRRAELARWLTDARNPLTWRCIVNRVWQLHFGRGLVDTPNDFGRMGGTPSHPELLDWLAAWFRDDASGSLKTLHRLIVTSHAYRQVTVPPDAGQRAAGAGIDSDNRLLWRMNRLRLDAECIRDAVLRASGRLDLRMGGPSDRQFDMKPGIHVTPLVNYTVFDPDTAAGHRRSVYRFLFRTLPDPWMDALDCPAGDQATPARNNGVTVQQALALWNSAFIASQSERLAAHLETIDRPVEKQVAQAVRCLLGREPVAEERRALSDYTARHGLANLCRVLFNSNEFLFLD